MTTLTDLYNRRAELTPAFHEYLSVCNQIVRMEHDTQGQHIATDIVPAKSVKRVAKPTKEELFIKQFSLLTKAQQEALLKGVSFDE